MISRVLFFAMCLGLFAASGAAQVWYVSPEGSDGQTGSQAEPFAAIQQALDVAGDGDTILLLPGVYTGPGNYDLQSSGISLTLRSSDPDTWNGAASTILDPQGAGSIFVFSNGQGLITIEGLTFQNALKEEATYPAPHGAAIMCINVNIVIRNCAFLNCQTDGLGGALYFYNSEASISHCIFAGNQAWDGGALLSDVSSNVQLEHCSIAGNVGLFYGGGVSCEFSSTLSITNSILWGNRLNLPEGLGSQAHAFESSIITIDYSVIEEGVDGIYDNGTGFILWGEGIIDADPLFAFFSDQDSPLLWDLRLKSQFGRWSPASQDWVLDTQTSPCIDAGPVDGDYSLEPWPNGRRPNIGAYGNTAQASLFGNTADLDVDGRVDMVDMAMLTSVWLSDPVDYEDFDGSETVDLGDLLVLAENWLWSISAL